MGISLSIDEKTPQETTTRILQTLQTLVSVLNVFHFAILCYILCVTLVSGFCLVNGNGTLVVPHAVWSLGIAISSFVVAMFSRFEVGLDLTVIVLDMNYCFAVLAVAIVCNAVALAFFGVEFVNATSDFYINSYGFLVGSIIVQAIAIALEFLLIGAIYVFQKQMKIASQLNWLPNFIPLADPKKTDDVKIFTPPKPKVDFDKLKTTEMAPSASEIRAQLVKKPRNLFK